MVDSEIIKKYGLALKYVENQTPELCLEAVKQNIMALVYVKEKYIKYVNEKYIKYVNENI